MAQSTKKSSCWRWQARRAQTKLGKIVQLSPHPPITLRGPSTHPPIHCLKKCCYISHIKIYYFAWSFSSSPSPSSSSKLNIILSDGGRWTYPVSLGDSGSSSWLSPNTVSPTSQLKVFFLFLLSYGTVRLSLSWVLDSKKAFHNQWQYTPFGCQCCTLFTKIVKSLFSTFKKVKLDI